MCEDGEWIVGSQGDCESDVRLADCRRVSDADTGKIADG